MSDTPAIDAVVQRKAEIAALRGQPDGPGRHRLVELLADPDTAVASAAAEALLGGDAAAWDAVLDQVWRSEDTGRTEAYRSAFVDRLLVGDPVEARLEQRAREGSPTASRGAREMLMELGMQPFAYIADVNEEES